MKNRIPSIIHPQQLVTRTLSYFISNMAFACENCGKSVTYGRQSSHGRGIAGKRWKKRAQSTLRTFKPNIQKIGVMVKGVKISMKLCTDCISRFKKDGKMNKPLQTASL